MQSRKRVALLISVVIIIVGAQFIRSIGTVSAAEAADRMEQIQAVLNHIESGRRALATAEAYGVEITFESGQGTWYKASENKMIISADYGPERAALSFMHEMVHAQTFVERGRADMTSMDRAGYVQHRVEEEAAGVVMSIEAKMELQKAGIDVAELHYPLEDRYLEAYRTAQQAAQVRERGISAEELALIGRQAGYARVVEGFMNGELWTSRSLEPYPDYYGKCYDRGETASSLLEPALNAGGLGQVLSQLVTDLSLEAC